MDAKEFYPEEEDKLLCASCLRFVAPFDAFRTFTTGFAMRADAKGCEVITGGGGYICRDCAAERRKEFEEQEKLRAEKRKA